MIKRLFLFDYIIIINELKTRKTPFRNKRGAENGH